MGTTNLAYRFRETSVRRYEKHIADIITRYPAVVVFEPANVETFSCRLRDAIKSFSEHHWPSKTIDPDKLTQPIRVAIRGSKVIAGGPNEVLEWGDSPEATEPSATERSSLVITNPDNVAIQSLMDLHHKRLLTTPTIVRFTDAQKAAFFQSIKWEEQFDVVVESQLAATPSQEYKIL